MINKKALADDLTNVFTCYQYRLDHPMPGSEETRNMIVKYRSDSIFRAKVKALVTGVMVVIDRNLD